MIHQRYQDGSRKQFRAPLPFPFGDVSLRCQVAQVFVADTSSLKQALPQTLGK